MNKYNRYRNSKLPNNSVFKYNVTCHEFKKQKEKIHHLFKYNLLKLLTGIDDTKEYGGLI